MAAEIYTVAKNGVKVRVNVGNIENIEGKTMAPNVALWKPGFQ
jgi:hypothetical protein